MAIFGKKKRASDSSSDPSQNEITEKHANYTTLSDAEVKQATKTRFYTALFTSICLVISVVFLIPVEVGNTSPGHGLSNIYFIRLNLANVVPSSVQNAVLLNSIAQSLGLHDYYQVGLWNYCEGYIATGITSCSPTQTLYAFNPVEIIRNQLIAGATITLPSEISDILDIIATASHFMFGLFLTSACLGFVLIFIIWLSVRSRWLAFLFSILTFLNALCVTAAAVIATVMFVIMRNVFESNTEVNIGATIGTTMFALMWIAAAFAIIAWLVQMGMCCCCASRRDIRRHTKKGEKKMRKMEGTRI